MAHKHSESFNHSINAAIPKDVGTSLTNPLYDYSQNQAQVSASVNNNNNCRCFFCGQARHPRARCPAREAQCNTCAKKGHFARVCRSAQP